MEEVAIETPTVSPEYDVMMKYPSIDTKEAKELLRITILQDVKDLEEYRTQLKENLIQTSTKYSNGYQDCYSGSYWKCCIC